MENLNLQSSELLALSDQSIQNLLQVLSLASRDLSRLNAEERNSLENLELQVNAERSRRQFN